MCLGSRREQKRDPVMSLVGEVHGHMLAARDRWRTIEIDHFDNQRQVADQLASATEFAGRSDPSDSRTSLLQVPFRSIQQLGCAMNVALAMSAALDLDPLRDFRLECCAEPLPFGETAGTGRLFEFAERANPQ